MPVFANLDVEESATVTARVATVTVTRGTTAEQQEILCLGDPDTSNAIAAVRADALPSTVWGLAVRLAGGPSSAVDCTIRAALSSTGADNPVLIASGNSSVTISAITGPVSTAAPAASDTGLIVRQVGYSTVVSIGAGNSSVTISAGNSSVTVSAFAAGLVSTAAPAATDAGLLVRQVGFSTVFSIGAGNSSVTISAGNSSVIVTAGNSSVTITAGNSSVTVSAFAAGLISSAASAANSSALLVRVVGGPSSAADFLATVNLRDGSSNALESSTQVMSSGSRGLGVRSISPGCTTYAASTAGLSSVTTILSSAAATRGYVYAYSITSTLAGPVTCGFYDGATLKWTVRLASISSAVSGANLAVTPPGYLFRGSTGAPLTFNVATSNAGMDVSVAMFRST